MNEEPFLAKLAEIAKVGRAEMADDLAITPEEWDSIELLDLIAAIDDSYGVTVDTSAIKKCPTVGALRGLVRQTAGV